VNLVAFEKKVNLVSRLMLLSFLILLSIFFQVEDAVNRVTDNTNAAHELDILSLRTQLGSLTTVRSLRFCLH
jgi:hypothetical protein